MLKNEREYVIKVDSAREKAYGYLRNKIMNLELSPGTMISTQNAADAIGISRTPVREAFLKLQQEQLLEISHQKPSLVSRIDLKRVRQECFVREALEAENMLVFAANPSVGAIRALERIIEEQKDALKEQDYERYQELDDRFHLLPLSETGQEMAAMVIYRMNGHYNRVRMLIRKSQDLSNDIIGEHRKLLECIKRKDADGATESLRQHIQAIQPIQDKLLKQYPDYFV